MWHSCYCTNTVSGVSHTKHWCKYTGPFPFGKEKNTQTKNRFTLFIFWCVTKLPNLHVRGGLFNCLFYCLALSLQRNWACLLDFIFFDVFALPVHCSFLNGLLSWESHFWDRHLNHNLHSGHFKCLRMNHSCLFIPCFNRDKYSPLIFAF